MAVSTNWLQSKIKKMKISFRRSNSLKMQKKLPTLATKQFIRIYDKATGKIRADLICLADEVFDPEKDMIIFDPYGNLEKDKNRRQYLYLT